MVSIKAAEAAPERLESQEGLAPLVHEHPARLGWHRHFSQIIFDPEQPYLVFSLTPEFPGCSPKLEARCIVWSLWALLASIHSPGAHQILTCECGYAPDAGLEAPIHVSHPDATSIVWELDMQKLAPALDETFFGQQDTLRLRFMRDVYESDIRAMLHEVQQTARNPVSRVDMSKAAGFEDFCIRYPECQFLPAEEFNPGERGCDLEDFLAVDADAIGSTRQG